MLYKVLYVLVKYLLESVAICVAIYLVNKNIKLSELMALTLTITASIIVLETFSPTILTSMRHGMGLGIGYNQVTGGGVETFDQQLSGNMEVLAGTPTEVINSMTYDNSNVTPYIKEL